MLVNADEEISSPASRGLITRLGSEHDAVFSCEGSDASDSLRLATSGNGAALLRVKGRSSHAGSAPADGRNALYELAHQILQMRDLSDPQTGATLNWTVARAGATRNIIPAFAEATADARVLRVRDWDALEARLKERITHKLIPETQVSVVLERRRPPLEASPASRAMAAHAARVYASIGRRLRVLGPVRGGRHRRGVRRAEDEGAGGGGVRPDRRRRALRRARIHRPAVGRTAPLSARAHRFWTWRQRQASVRQ